MERTRRNRSGIIHADRSAPLNKTLGVMKTVFAKLNSGWNAEPNPPEPTVAVEGNDVLLSFFMNPFQFPEFSAGDLGTLRFANCSRYRLGPTNDEGWYRGQCRFSGLAPAWGEFYEVSGDLLLEKAPSNWVVVDPGRTASRHFLFYLRDETFECGANAWSLQLIRALADETGARS